MSAVICACQTMPHEADCPVRVFGAQRDPASIPTESPAEKFHTGGEVTDDVPVAVLFTKEAGEILDMLVDTGLFGRDRADVVERLACEKLRHLMDKGWLAGDEDDE